MFMAAMEMTVVSTAMPTVVAELGGALHYAWVFTAYMLTSTVTVPIYGKLADLYGRKPVILVAMALFLVGSMASGQSHTMTQLIVFRAVQGVGAGGMQPIALTVVGDIFDIKERAKMQGVFGAVWAIAGLVGPLVGGVVVATLSWRWVFYLNVPFGLVSAAVLTFSLVENVQKREHRLDIVGAVVLTAAVIALLLGVDGHAPAVLLPVAALGTAAFLFVEMRAKEPLLPLAMFRQRVFATTSALSALSGGAMLGLVTFVPLYAQGVLGTTPTKAGSMVAAMAVAWPVASALSGRLIVKVGFTALVRAGYGICALGSLLLLYFVSHGAGATELRIASALFGVGMGLATAPLVIGVQTSVAFAQRGVATASTMFFRNIGGTVGVGVMGVILADALLAGPAKEAGGAGLVAQILGPERRHLDPGLLATISGDLGVGVVHVIYLIAGMSVAAALLAWMYRGPTPVPDK